MPDMEHTDGLSDEALFGPGHLEWGPVGRLNDAAIEHRQDLRRIKMSAMGAWAELEGLGGSPYQVQASAARVIADELGRDEAEALAALASRALARLDKIDERYGQDAEDGSVIRFVRHIRTRAYSYAAIRAGGYWYVTGSRSPQHVTWNELVRWLDHEKVEQVERLVCPDFE